MGQAFIARRDLLISGAVAGGVTSLASSAAAQSSIRLPVPGRFPIVVFSKHLHWASYSESAEILREIGAEGVDLTVRPGGHVEPERVREDLPRAVEIFRKSGTPVVMITTEIKTVDSPHTEAILESAKSLGITHYRWGDLPYERAVSLPEQLKAFKPKISALAKLNSSMGMTAMYHIHSGFNRLGTCVWDLWELIRDEDPNAVSFNYDIGHATVEGGFGGWVNSMRLALPYMRGTAAKDFIWEKTPAGQWRPRWCRLGDGMVDWSRYFAMLKQAKVPMPLQLHLEYEELGAAGTGKKTLDLPKERVVGMIRRDLEKLKELRGQAGLG